MSDEIDPLQYTRPRDPGIRRRISQVDPLADGDPGAFADAFDAVDPIEDKAVDIFYLLDSLEELVSIGKRFPFSGKVMVDENEFLTLVDQLRIAVPNEIKQATRVIRERQLIIELFPTILGLLLSGSKMPGPFDADGNPFGACIDVIPQGLECHDPSRPLPEEQLQHLGRTISYDHIEDVIHERDSILSQERGYDPRAFFPTSGASLNHPGITPMMPEQLQRYSNRPKLGTDSVKAGLTVEMWNSQQIKPNPPSGWEEIVHPEGGRYFLNREKRAYTDADLHDPKHYRKAMADLDIIENFLAKHALLLPDSCQLVFDLFITGEIIEMKYYFVNHQRKSIFHLDTFVVEPWIDTPGRLGESFF
jgi:hypothetical protein